LLWWFQIGNIFGFENICFFTHKTVLKFKNIQTQTEYFI